MSSDEVTIYHNPSCGTSRNTLALIREAGIEPKVIEYLKTPADKKTLRELLAKTKLTPRELMREKEVEKLGWATPRDGPTRRSSIRWSSIPS